MEAQTNGYVITRCTGYAAIHRSVCLCVSHCRSLYALAAVAAIESGGITEGITRYRMVRSALDYV